MSDVIIEIRGGNVVGVYGKSEKTRVTIVDWDNWEANDIPTPVYTMNCLLASSVSEETANIIILSKTNSKD